MTPRQLKKFLADAGLTQRGAAQDLGINERTMRRYISGDHPVPLVVEFAVRWLASTKGSAPEAAPAKHK